MPLLEDSYKQTYLPGRFRRTIVAALLVWCTVSFLPGCNSTGPVPSFDNVPAILAQPPCVASVCVGAVGRQRVIEELSENELLFNIRDNGGAPVWFSIEEGGTGGIIFGKDNLGVYEVAEQIRLRVTGMPLGKILDTLGEPDELFLIFGCGRGVHVHGKLFYREEGIEVQVQFPAKMGDRSTPMVINESTPVQWIWYFDPLLYDEWLAGIPEDLQFRNGYFDIPRGLTAETVVAAIQPWPGLETPVQTLDLCPR
jgi:hypothetical protein